MRPNVRSVLNTSFPHQSRFSCRVSGTGPTRTIDIRFGETSTPASRRKRALRSACQRRLRQYFSAASRRNLVSRAR